MIDLDLHAISWCPAHGHPALIYREPTSDLGITIGVAADDAQLLAGFESSGRATAMRLLEAIIESLNGTIVDVRLSVTEDRSVRTEMMLAGPTGLSRLPVHAADGLILARRAGVPVRIRPANLHWLRREADQTRPTPDPLAAFRARVEEPDLDGLGDSSL